MKKVLALIFGLFLVLSALTSCDNKITEDDELFFQHTQAIDKDDSTTPNSDGGTTLDPDED